MTGSRNVQMWSCPRPKIVLPPTVGTTFCKFHEIRSLPQSRYVFYILFFKSVLSPLVGARFLPMKASRKAQVWKCPMPKIVLPPVVGTTFCTFDEHHKLMTQRCQFLKFMPSLLAGARFLPMKASRNIQMWSLGWALPASIGGPQLPVCRGHSLRTCAKDSPVSALKRQLHQEKQTKETLSDFK